MNDSFITGLGVAGAHLLSMGAICPGDVRIVVMEGHATFFGPWDGTQWQKFPQPSASAPGAAGRGWRHLRQRPVGGRPDPGPERADRALQRDRFGLQVASPAGRTVVTAVTVSYLNNQRLGFVPWDDRVAHTARALADEDTYMSLTRLVAGAAVVIAALVSTGAPSPAFAAGRA